MSQPRSRRALPVRTLLAVALAVGMLSASASAQQAVTLEALLAAPFPSEIAAAPVGGRVAWVQNAKGSRNVWIAASPDFAPRQLTTFVGDDGQDITSLTWSPDGKALLFVRGGGPIARARFPIRRSRRRRGAGDLGSRPRQRRRARKLTTGSSPAISSMATVAYLSRGQVWSHERRPPRRSRLNSSRFAARPGPEVVTRRHPPRVCQRARRSQLHRRRTNRGEGDSLPRPERRSRRQSDLVARRITHRVHPHASDGRDLHVRASPRSATLVDPRR